MPKTVECTTIIKSKFWVFLKFCFIYKLFGFILISLYEAHSCGSFTDDRNDERRGDRTDGRGGQEGLTDGSRGGLTDGSR